MSAFRLKSANSNTVSVVLHFKLQGDAEPQRHVLQCRAGAVVDVDPASTEGTDHFVAFPIAPEKQHRPGFVYVESVAFELLARKVD